MNSLMENVGWYCFDSNSYHFFFLILTITFIFTEGRKHHSNSMNGFNCDFLEISVKMTKRCDYLHILYNVVTTFKNRP